MVLPLKRWKSRASPGIAAGAHDLSDLEEPIHNSKGGPLSFIRRMSAFFRFAVLKQKAFGGAGWSSPVARQAHNLKVVGSNPTPATNKQGPLAGPFLLVVASCGFDPRSAGAAKRRRPTGEASKSYSRNQRISLAAAPLSCIAPYLIRNLCRYRAKVQNSLPQKLTSN